MPQSFNVSATCASGYKGTASASTCKAAGTPYSLAGCEPETCTPPSTEHMKGYELQAFSLKRPSFSVTVKCSSGVGVGKAKPCARDGEPYTLGGCFIGECASPVAHASQGYIVHLDVGHGILKVYYGVLVIGCLLGSKSSCPTFG